MNRKLSFAVGCFGFQLLRPNSTARILVRELRNGKHKVKMTLLFQLEHRTNIQKYKSGTTFLPVPDYLLNFLRTICSSVS
jgi:hypothetical protein